ncbi:MAG: M48 family metalloprotease [Myxococcota bacterium]
MRHSPTPRLVSLLLCLSLVGCGGGSARRPRTQVVLSSEAVDEKVGREESENVAAQLGLIDDPALNAYVSQVGQRLARYAPRGRFRYHFAIVDQDTPNAFALPGGYIYVSRGLLVLTNSEDELASVLGHEITHVAARHAAARQAVIQGMPGPFQFFAQGHIAGYSRNQEREADRIGQGLAGVAGFDPTGMATFLKDLEFTERLRLGTSRLPSFYDTHPATSERVASAAARARLVSWERVPGVASDQADYLSRIEGLVVGTSAAEGVFRGQRFLHPDLDFTVRFPDGWKTMNTHVAVGGVSRLRDAQFVLEGQGPGDDPETAATEYLGKPQNQGISIATLAPLKIGSHRAYRVEGKVRTRGGFIPITMTWVAKGGVIYRFTALSAPGAFARIQSTYSAFVRSFRPLPPGLARSVREDHLHVVRARAGETLKALSARTGNQWDIQTTAVINDVFATEPLGSDQLMKVAVSQAYVPEPASR